MEHTKEEHLPEMRYCALVSNNGEKSNTRSFSPTSSYQIIRDVSVYIVAWLALEFGVERLLQRYSQLRALSSRIRSFLFCLFSTSAEGGHMYFIIEIEIGLVPSV
ncbi:hypothetical protein TNCT_560021 [Trichonephila clavata]|uniref:Uncharacterized protein n=1 Tax=Trichonephila clavata TaxID=2740835 RepID=A0A8X6J5E2_TRICU|nr:hypothetical protein TNCT_560021 [Trichonephila clavata]